MHCSRCIIATLIVSVFLSANAQTQPTSLADLQQSFERAVADKATAPYRAAVAELNQKYGAALDRLTASATQAGDLDTALALRDEKKLLLPEGSLPEDTETTPAALKSARVTYRQQISVLQASRDAAVQPLRDHFRALLQPLLTQATQAGRLDEALAIREKIASLNSGSATTSAPLEASPAPKPKSPSSSKLITAKSSGKTDPEAAKQIITWALANNAVVTTSAGIVGEGEKLTAMPVGKFSITKIICKGIASNFPWTALAGLGQLEQFVPNQEASLTAEQTRHFHNLGSLRFLKMIDITEDGLQALPVLPNLNELMISFGSSDPLSTLHLLQERTASIQILTPFRLPSGEVADALYSRLSGWPNFKKLGGPTRITPSRAAHLIAHPKFDSLGLMTGCKVEEGCLSMMKNLVSFESSGPQPVSVLKELPGLPKLKIISLDLEGTAAGEFPDFRTCRDLSEIRLDNISTPVTEVVGKCAGIAGLKIYKLGHAQIEPGVIAALLSLKGLEVISLNDCTFTPDALASLPQLKGIQSLKELNLKNSGISSADLKALQKALPKCTIRP